MRDDFEFNVEFCEEVQLYATLYDYRLQQKCTRPGIGKNISEIQLFSLSNHKGCTQYLLSLCMLAKFTRSNITWSSSSSESIFTSHWQMTNVGRYPFLCVLSPARPLLATPRQTTRHHHAPVLCELRLRRPHDLPTSDSNMLQVGSYVGQIFEVWKVLTNKSM